MFAFLVIFCHFLASVHFTHQIDSWNVTSVNHTNSSYNATTGNVEKFMHEVGFFLYCLHSVLFCQKLAANSKLRPQLSFQEHQWQQHQLKEQRDNWEQSRNLPQLIQLPTAVTVAAAVAAAIVPVLVLRRLPQAAPALTGDREDRVVTPIRRGAITWMACAVCTWYLAWYHCASLKSLCPCFQWCVVGQPPNYSQVRWETSAARSCYVRNKL